MEKIAIIGGGIIGMTTANYLDTDQFKITLFDYGVGQATKASAGIISPWLSKRRNKTWYRLAKDGAAFFPKIVQDFALDSSIYAQTGTLIIRKKEKLTELLELAEERKKEAPEIGELKLLAAEQTAHLLPLLNQIPSLYVTGGGRLNGKAYLHYLSDRLERKGITIINDKVQLQKRSDSWLIQGAVNENLFDRVILTAGPSLKSLLKPLGYRVDIRPQKGQLIAFDTPYNQSQNWPVAMLDGEADLIPFNHGKILLGATHENEAMWDLTPTKEAYIQLTESTKTFLAEPEKLLKQPYHLQVGTRAYTSDFSPFFGPLPDDTTLLVASGLGSSGLTTGPYIGYLLAKYLNTGKWYGGDYQKNIGEYIKK